MNEKVDKRLIELALLATTDLGEALLSLEEVRREPTAESITRTLELLQRIQSPVGELYGLLEIEKRKTENKRQ